ncbi:hypothetical protein MKW94_001738 [Papaver nudicaule]|uniref:N-acetyltransferase domain-containing protein n=1 Tax=Papaver nudicaule TaxID=74823 RepID=A0AA41SF01_PAPNU|nr:hypothetical protein [Papaver nudicaule]
MFGKKARIGNVVVVKLARGQGVASRMVKFAIEIAKKKGVPQMFVKPDLDNELAQAPYKKMGFMTSNSSQSVVRRNDKDNLLVQENPSRHVARFVQVTPSSLN